MAVYLLNTILILIFIQIYFIFLSHMRIFSNNVLLIFLYKNMGTYADNMNKTSH